MFLGGFFNDFLYRIVEMINCSIVPFNYARLTYDSLLYSPLCSFFVICVIACLLDCLLESLLFLPSLRATSIAIAAKMERCMCNNCNGAYVSRHTRRKHYNTGALFVR